MSIFDSFEKKHDYLVCVDSDGCVMDTMNCKHFNCFGPRMVDEWALELWRAEILERWNEINLFSMTRGINRFKGLAMALEEIDQKYKPIPGVAALRQWVDHAPLSAMTEWPGLLKRLMILMPSGFFQKRCPGARLSMLLSWSSQRR